MSRMYRGDEQQGRRLPSLWAPLQETGRTKSIHALAVSDRYGALLSCGRQLAPQTVPRSARTIAAVAVPRSCGQVLPCSLRPDGERKGSTREARRMQTTARVLSARPSTWGAARALSGVTPIAAECDFTPHGALVNDDGRPWGDLDWDFLRIWTR